jgi:ribosomal protein S18 acetylase RimI-like enzyme
MEACELRLIEGIDRSEDLGHHYLCIPTRDGLGLRLVRQALDPPRRVPSWSPSELESHLTEWGHRLQAGAVLLGGFRDDALAGFVLFWVHTQPRRGEIHSLCVDVRHRGRGLGISLLHHAEANCRARGCCTLVLSTGYSAPAVDFYLRHGFRIAGIQDPRLAPRGSALTLAKELCAGQAVTSEP